MAEQNTPFSVNELIEELRIASRKSDAGAQVKSILKQVVSNPDWVRATIPNYEGNEVILFEDDSVSIWHCRFPVGQSVPAHDHQMVATIAVYRGAERNDMWVRDDKGGIEKKKQIDVSAGDVLQLGPDAIHSVGCGSQVDSCAIHVYLGKLTTVERSLFDISTGAVMAFDDDNYQRLTSAD